MSRPRIEINVKAIPAAFRELPQWVGWRYEQREDGSWTKVPYQVVGDGTKHASVTDPKSWVPFQVALKAVSKFDGIGFVVTKDDPFCGADLDDCLENGELHPDALAVVNALDSYTEITPSGRGVRVFVRAELGSGRSTKGPWGGKIEIYDRKRFFTFTGHALNGRPPTVNRRQARLDSVLDEYLSGRDGDHEWDGEIWSTGLSDEEVLARARAAENAVKFVSLYDDGDISEYDDDDSRADYALVHLLAFWTGPDPEQIERLFSGSALGQRDKWTDRDDYPRRTIHNALGDHDDYWTPGESEDQRFERRVDSKLGTLRVNKEAARRLRAEELADTSGRVADGGEFIFEHEIEVVIWGAGERSYWNSGEPLMETGPIGIGKTTLMQNLALRRGQIVRGKLLGFPVLPAEGRILYIAADRPRQIRRSFRRMIEESKRETVNKRLIVWRGPLPFDLGACERGDFTEFIASFDNISDVYVDSLKDVALGLVDDTVGAAINSEYQLATAEGYELCTNHHPRKATSENKRPNTLDDVYGSTWIVAGHGSVLLVWGQRGDSIVDIRHLKFPSEQIELLKVHIDRARGTVELAKGKTDLVALARESDGGLTARAAAQHLYSVNEPSKPQVERARQKLNRDADLERIEDADPAAWRARTK